LISRRDHLRKYYDNNETPPDVARLIAEMISPDGVDVVSYIQVGVVGTNKGSNGNGTPTVGDIWLHGADVENVPSVEVWKWQSALVGIYHVPRRTL
jgi:hypothetical protein